MISELRKAFRFLHQNRFFHNHSVSFYQTFDIIYMEHYLLHNYLKQSPLLLQSNLKNQRKLLYKRHGKPYMNYFQKKMIVLFLLDHLLFLA